MADDIAEPYGPLITTTFRLVTWNVWGRYGPWERREAAIRATLERHDPDVVGLVEAWDGQGARLGLPYHVFEGDYEVDGVRSGLAVLSRWPIGAHESRKLTGGPDTGGQVLYAGIDGPRGVIHVYVAALTWRPEHSGERQRQVREMAAFVAETRQRRQPTVLCGDFNADPDSDELRMLTGKSAAAAPGLVFYDAWATAGTDPAGGHTWAGANPWAAPALWPDRRIDHVLSAWPRRGGAGHPVRCEVIGDEPVGGVVPSDHYGVLADLRY
ncbi:endonuclease/exonuclease/phosphatase family protein [Streptosporangium sp. NPDC023963]|uniref:endonuclease/exonuclease/phosphatase family protein n=1 Tax=Streptosporangium sp. NPDC023963 TaxID=3155608 RepID=UPI003415BDB0